MKSSLSIALAFIFTALLSTGASAANSKSDALNECKAHLDGLYQDGVRSKVKRIKRRSGDYEVQMKVSANGERFNAVCAFADGNMTYTTDQTASSSIAD
jgi:hypothetical protein